MLTVLRHSARNYWTSECRVATGRSAIKHLIDIAQPKTVLMPCYVPEGVINPFRRENVTIRFYRLRSDLTPDFDDLQAKISKGAMVVVIHYFGFKARTKAIRQLVDNVGGLLFEDCAHAMSGPASQADDADVALWVLNKTLPVVDGAILRSRRRDIDVTGSWKGQLPGEAVKAYQRHLDINAQLARSSDMTLLSDSDLAYEQYYKINGDMSPLAQSEESRCIESSLDLDALHEIKTQNVVQYLNTLPKEFIWCDQYPVAPMAFPIMVKPPLKRRVIFNALLEKGVLASMQIDKWDHVEAGYIHEREFIDQHLLLPVGEGVGRSVVRDIAACLRECYES